MTAPPPTDIYTLSLHDALPISLEGQRELLVGLADRGVEPVPGHAERAGVGVVEDLRVDVEVQVALVDEVEVGQRSEEHTSELQSRLHLVCRLLLEKKKETRDHK